MATASDVCGLCFKEPVFGFCENCSIRLGERCYSKHSKIVIFTGHTVFPLDNIDYKKLVPVEKDIHEQKCQMHATDPQSFYCGKHEVTICGRCLLIDHKTCTNEIVDLHTTTFDEHKTDELIDSLKEIEEEIKDL
ncbi:hypothetical protein DPMN_137390 [Dreissena polymorpha]|uniref:B box-type domain-containing protein n=1 Tax=Dreissena polymorpha TaxID=45954 RepID=A0A9D4G7Q6_DREPO|nr:hypothetical protein DPMN_137390 [Dreissena polymorpha]